MTIKGNFEKNDTMKWIAKSYPISGDSIEYSMVCDILEGYDLTDTVMTLTRDDILWLASSFITVGKRIGISEERTRRKYGNKKNNNR